MLVTSSILGYLTVFSRKRTHCNGSEYEPSNTSNLNLNVCIIFSVEFGGRHGYIMEQDRNLQEYKEQIQPQLWIYMILALPKRAGRKCERECHDTYAAHGDICVQNRGTPRSEVYTAISVHMVLPESRSE